MKIQNYIIYQNPNKIYQKELHGIIATKEICLTNE